MATTTRRELTAHERECAMRINKLWSKKKREEKISQAVAADAMNITPSGFNQYINGVIPLNTNATYNFAKYFGVAPQEIDPHWLGEGPSSHVSEAERIYLAISDVSTKEQDMAAIKSIAGRVSPKDALEIARFFIDRAAAGL